MRVRGEALLMQSPDNKTEAEATLQEALVIARRQACHPLELRAATSLAWLLRDGGREQQARELLAPVYDAYTEGFERPDLQAAHALLAELN
jgi:predicted ATPase